LSDNGSTSGHPRRQGSRAGAGRVERQRQHFRPSSQAGQQGDK